MSNYIQLENKNTFQRTEYLYRFVHHLQRAVISSWGNHICLSLCKCTTTETVQVGGFGGASDFSFLTAWWMKPFVRLLEWPLRRQHLLQKAAGWRGRVMDGCSHSQYRWWLSGWGGCYRKPGGSSDLSFLHFALRSISAQSALQLQPLYVDLSFYWSSHSLFAVFYIF